MGAVHNSPAALPRPLFDDKLFNGCVFNRAEVRGGPPLGNIAGLFASVSYSLSTSSRLRNPLAKQEF
eukprot:9054300-Pyramimonas_sp.AAC.1